MGKLERQAKKAARKAGRKERKKQFKRLIKAIKNAEITFKPDGDAKLEFVDVFKEIWEILDPALKYAVAMEKTNEATDKVLNDVWDAGNAIANGGGASDQSDFIQKFGNIWDKLEKPLQLLQLILNKKANKTINRIMEIGDWIADGGED